MKLSHLFLTTLVFIFSFQASGQINEAIKIKITCPNGNTDEMIVRLKGDATNSFDPAWDAWKMFTWNDMVPSIYSQTDLFGDLAINSIPHMQKDSIIPVFMRAKLTSGTYNITTELLGTPPTNIKIALKDLQSGEIYILEQNISHDFPVIADAINDQHRFDLFYSPVALLDFTENDIQLTNLGCMSWNYIIEDENQNVVFNGFVVNEQIDINDLVVGDYVAYISDDYLLSDSIPFQITFTEEEDGTQTETFEENAAENFSGISSNLEKEEIIVYSSNDHIIIESEENGGFEVNIYSLSGQLLSRQEFFHETQSLIELINKPTVVIVLIRTPSRTYSQKLILH